ncbi:MAG TPA: peptidase M1 [Cytophagales bacterium]|nr:peptidase M1 [Cytophagales bacterium]
MKSIQFVGLSVLAALFFSCTPESVEKGVSYELAQTRKESIKDIQYALHFDIPLEQNKNIAGTNTITFLYKKNTSKNLYLDFNEEVDHLQEVKVNQKVTDVIFENEHIAIPNTLLVEGKNVIEITFTAGDLSLNRNEEYLYTLFVPDRASTCFPGFDQPDLKASFVLSMSIPNEWEAISNQSATITGNADEKRLYQFLPTQPISTYQFAFAAGKFEKTTDSETGMTMYYRETDSAKVASNVKAIFALHSEAMEWLKNYTSIAYPFEKMDFALIPAFQYGGMEHPGSIFYRESSLILEPSASVNQRMRRASLIAHETAHMWFGNLVTMKWFEDVWLKEVFANFMAAKMVNPQFPEINHNLRFLMAHYPSAYEIDRSEGAHPIQQKLDNLKNAGTLYGAIIYQKAPIMMRNLETMMGEESFRNGLRDYLLAYSYSNASWDDLVNSLKKFTDKNLTLWDRAWIKSKGMPDLNYTLNSELTIRVSNDSTGIVWPQTFQYLFNGDKEELKDIFIESTDGYTTPVTNTQSMVIPNYKGRGYGYFAADEPSRKYMLSKVSDIQNPEARAGVWLNIWEYVLRGELEPQQVMETMLLAITKEKDPLLLEYVTNRMNNLFWQFTKPEDRQLISKNIDDTLFELMALEKDNSLKRVLFNCFTRIASSTEGIENLRKFWQNEMTLGLDISEQDHIDLAYELSLRDPKGSNEILQTQLSDTQNPDRKEAMKFIMQALSGEATQRDAFFESLKEPVNREHEPWVLEALGYLHHPLRADQSVQYIRPSLDMLQEIQLTGDIFFPKGWVEQTVSSYQSKEAADIVRQYLKDNPGLSDNLRNKLLQSADPLFRAEKILSIKQTRNM